MDFEALRKLLPAVTNENRPYFEGWRDHELRLQVCTSCRRPRFPPAPVCPNCLSAQTHWETASGRGTVWSWVVMHQRYFAAFADELPYAVALVRLEEGPLMVSRVVDSPPALACDAPVQVVFQQLEQDFAMPSFRIVL